MVGWRKWALPCADSGKLSWNCRRKEEAKLLSQIVKLHPVFQIRKLWPWELTSHWAQWLPWSEELCHGPGSPNRVSPSHTWEPEWRKIISSQASGTLSKDTEHTVWTCFIVTTKPWETASCQARDPEVVLFGAWVSTLSSRLAFCTNCHVIGFGKHQETCSEQIHKIIDLRYDLVFNLCREARSSTWKVTVVPGSMPFLWC